MPKRERQLSISSKDYLDKIGTFLMNGADKSAQCFYTLSAVHSMCYIVCTTYTHYYCLDPSRSSHSPAGVRKIFF